MPTVVPREGSCFKKWIKYWSLSSSSLLCLHAVSQWDVLWGMSYVVIWNIRYMCVTYVVIIFQRTPDRICLSMILIHNLETLFEKRIWLQDWHKYLWQWGKYCIQDSYKCLWQQWKSSTEFRIHANPCDTEENTDIRIDINPCNTEENNKI